ncbi:LexA family protein [Terriglobus albidus]|uniref:LexA family protein n=1 Tax=Terriglobus albidus TaxID=1592106 RepID=UPI0021DFFB45|nr:hypothetical protein [Terriglobus albidus]
MYTHIKPLTKREEELLRVASSYQASYGFMPTYEEIAESMDVGKAFVQSLVNRLTGKGYIQRRHGARRSFRINPEGPKVHPGTTPSRDRFVRWVKKVGHSSLARQIGTTRYVVHSWTNSNADRPKPPSMAFATKMVELSRQHQLPDGPLTFEDIYDGTTGLRGQTRSVEVPPPAPQITAGASANA